MKKLYFTLFIGLFFSNYLIAQVGIGTNLPDSQLDIRSSSQTIPLNTDGLLIPKVDVFPAVNPTAAQQSMLVYLTTPTTFGGNPKPIGFYYWNNFPADWIGISSAVSGDHDWYEVGTTLPPNAITDDMFHTGNVAIGKNTANSALDVFSSGAAMSGIINSLNSTVTAGGASIKQGIANGIQGTSNDVMMGQANAISNSGTGIHYGVANQITSPNSSFIYGFNNVISSNSNTFGNNNFITNNSTATATIVSSYGSNLAGSSEGLIKGVDTSIGITGAGNHYGTYNSLSSPGNSATNSNYGVYNILSGAGTKNKYGTYNFINSTAGGIHYGIYSEVLKAGATNFAGYFLGNVGIGTTTANTYTLPPSRGLASQIMTTDGFGNVSWQNGTAFPCWGTLGNTGTNGGNTTSAGINFLGTTDNQNINIRTNNIYRARFSNLGEFFVGTLNTILPGDLMNGVGNATFPWAVNGYTDQNGGGVYGQVTAGTTLFAGVQGEYNGTNARGAGVRGSYQTGTSGTGFGPTLALPNNGPATGVNGNATTAGTYKFGVYGSGGATTRSGAVMGYDFGVAIGALGYFAASGIDYGVYGFGQAYQVGAAGGRLSSSHTAMDKNTNIGIGIYGGVMGGWVRGMKYGFHTKGETYSLYVDGNGYINKPLAYLIQTDGTTKTASFISTSMKPEVTVNGKINLESGKVFVPFDRNFSKVISNIDDVIITASPQGRSNGVYIDQITKEGFWIIENNDGISNVKIAWIAITKIKGEENPEIPNDLIANDFDDKMDKVMYNDNNLVDTPQSLWWDGTKIRWDKPSNDKIDTQTENLSRPKIVKKQ